MQRLFHAFPRPAHHTDAATGRLVRDPITAAGEERGFSTLKLILDFGILCTREYFPIHASPMTNSQDKAALALACKPYRHVIQSRACFTLMHAHDLSRRYEIAPGQAVSHCDLFGPFAIGMDALAARELGIMPTVYYYAHEHRHAARPKGVSGLGSQIIQRLDELWNLMCVLAHVEAKAVTDVAVPNEALLVRMGIEILHEEDVLRRVQALSPEQATDIFNLFNTARVGAWNLTDFIKMLLSLYQTVDSTLEDAPLAFFQQREWRLVHHMREGTVWFSLADGATMRVRDPDLLKARKVLTEDLAASHGGKAHPDPNFLPNAWVLYSADSLPFRTFIREIVVPETFIRRTQALVDSYDFPDGPPVVKAALNRWRLDVSGREPRVVCDGEEPHRA